MKTRILILPLLLASCAAFGQSTPQPQPRARGVESSDYVWNEMTADKVQALQAKGDAARGKTAFATCQGCHRHGATGRPDGKYPRLAGQHATVLIKQMADIRAGRRDNWKMYPFADDHVLSPQDMADIAVYVQALPVNPDQGTGPGKDLARAQQLYERDCSNCHGKDGYGSARDFYPRLAGQHYAYLLRESVAIRDGGRRNANPDMMKAVKPYSDTDLAAVSDYVSRLALR